MVQRPRTDGRWMPVVAGVVVILAAFVPIAQATPGRLPPPVRHGVPSIEGDLRDGGTVRAVGVSWRPAHVKPGYRILSFQVAYLWRACTTAHGPCVQAADTAATPFAASSYIVGHADVGRYLALMEIATQVVQIPSSGFSFRVVRAAVGTVTRAAVQPYAGGAPTTEFVNGTPEPQTASTEEYFQVDPPHYLAADGRPHISYRVDAGAWKRVGANRRFYTGTLDVGPHRVTVRTANDAGTTTRSFDWQVVPMPAPAPCVGSCWYPSHLDATGHPMRWDWQIGRSTPLQRKGDRAVDLYDVDGFLTTPAQIDQIHTSWQASTLPHPKVACYLDMAWEDYRPDATRSSDGGVFPEDTLGNVYYGYPQERWVDFRQLDALKPMLESRIQMCADKGFDAIELDDIDSFEPASTTGFNLTPGDAMNFLAYADNLIHQHGMTVLWKNTGILSWWARDYADGAVVEECYAYHECFASQLVGESNVGITCTALTDATPCGWDDFTTDVTANQPTGKWVGEAEYGADRYVCDPGQTCPPKRTFAHFCDVMYAPSYGYAAVKFGVNLNGTPFFPCPTGV